ncbi:MAG: ABC transporter permease [Actinobacteria bacterium]|nr:ABC transporter permease [Actinomycetota bacterium]
MMGAINRGLRSFVRHPLSNLVVVLLIFVCLTFSLSMLAVKLSADAQVEEVKSGVGNYAELRVSSEYQMKLFSEQREQDPARRQAEARKMSGEELLAERTSTLVPEEMVDGFSLLPEIISFDKVLETRVSLEGITGSELETMLSLRQGMPGSSSSSASADMFQFEGNTNGASASDFLLGNKALAEGSFYTYQDHLNANPVVLVERTLAEENGLSVGDTITAAITGAEGRGSEMELEIIGIYETVEAEARGAAQNPQAFNPAGNKFFAPLSVVQELNGTPGYVELGYYYLDSADSSAAVQAAFQEMVVEGLENGDKYELATDYSDFESISDPLQKTGKASTIGLAGALGACALIIILAMAIIVGGRTRELGVLKAIGATDRQVLVQYAAEVLCLCLVAIVLAAGASAFISQRMGNWLLQGNAAATEQTTFPGGADTPPMRGISGNLYKEGGRFSFASGNRQGVELDVIYRGSMLVYGILILLGISLLGMSVPVIWISRLRPARVLTME